VPLGLTQTAADVLDEWERVGGVGLYYSGYLDLAEHVWGCVAQMGQGYVVVAVVDERFALDDDLGIFDENEPSSCRLTLVIPEA
jgi:hypothetical protein